MLSFFAKGLVIGISIAAPVGPIGALCIRRSLAEGRAIGFATGLGAATADALYGCVVAFGLTAISSFLTNQQFWLSSLGGIFLLYLGAQTFRAAPAEHAMTARASTLLSAFATTLFLTLANPATILSFVGLFGATGFAASPNIATAAVLVLGVFLGSALWWLILSSSVDLLRSRFGPNWMRPVNRLSGCILIVFGAFAIFNTIK
jgi:threonine/homoserine/homoserine lactone efflux protein